MFIHRLKALFLQLPWYNLCQGLGILILVSCTQNNHDITETAPEPYDQSKASAASDRAHDNEKFSLNGSSIMSGKVVERLILPPENGDIASFLDFQEVETGIHPNAPRPCKNGSFKVTKVASNGTIVANGKGDETGEFSVWTPAKSEFIIEFDQCNLKCIASSGESNIQCDPFTDIIINLLEDHYEESLSSDFFLGVKLVNIIKAAALKLRWFIGDKRDHRTASQMSICQNKKLPIPCLLDLFEKDAIATIIPAIDIMREKYRIRVQGDLASDPNAYAGLYTFSKVINLLTSLDITVHLTDAFLENIYQPVTTAPTQAQQNHATTIIEVKSMLDTQEEATPQLNSGISCEYILFHPLYWTLQVIHLKPSISAPSEPQAITNQVCPLSAVLNQRIDRTPGLQIESRLVFKSNKFSTQSNPQFFFTPHFNLTFPTLDKLIQVLSNAEVSRFSIQDIAKAISDSDLPISPEQLALLPSMLDYPSKSLIFDRTLRPYRLSNENNSLFSFEALAFHPKAKQGDFQLVPITCDIPSLTGGHINAGKIHCSKPKDYQFAYDRYALLSGSPNKYLLAPSGANQTLTESYFRVLFKDGSSVRINQKLLVVKNQNFQDSVCRDPDLPPVEKRILIESDDGLLVNQDVLVICHDLDIYNNSFSTPIQTYDSVSADIIGRKYRLPLLVNPLDDQQPLCITTQDDNALATQQFDHNKITLAACSPDLSDQSTYLIAALNIEGSEPSSWFIPLTAHTLQPTLRASASINPVETMNLPAIFQKTQLFSRRQIIDLFSRSGVPSSLPKPAIPALLVYNSFFRNEQDPFFEDQDDDGLWGCQKPPEYAKKTAISQLSESGCLMRKENMEPTFSHLPDAALQLMTDHPEYFSQPMETLTFSDESIQILQSIWPILLSCEDNSLPQEIDFSQLPEAVHDCHGKPSSLKFRKILAKVNTPLATAPDRIITQILFAYKDVHYGESLSPADNTFDLMQTLALIQSFMHMYMLPESPHTPSQIKGPYARSFWFDRRTQMESILPKLVGP